MTERLVARARVLVVEDDDFTRATVCGALTGAGVNVVAGTGSAAGALDLAARHEPHAALIDLDLGSGPDGIDVAIALRNAFPLIGITILTSYADPRVAGRTTRDLPGGAAYLAKGEMSSVDAIIRALAASMKAAASPTTRALPPRSSLRGSTAALTDNQVEVARMVADGLSNAEIAARRGVSAATVERTIMRIAQALSIETTSATNRRVLIAREFMRRDGG